MRGAGGGSLGDLLRAELSPYGGDGSRLTLSGPTVWLDARAFSVMALVLQHELSTNAAKYGALSRLGGRLEVTWRVTPRRLRGGVARAGRPGCGRHRTARLRHGADRAQRAL